MKYLRVKTDGNGTLEDVRVASSTEAVHAETATSADMTNKDAQGRTIHDAYAIKASENTYTARQIFDLESTSSATPIIVKSGGVLATIGDNAGKSFYVYTNGANGMEVDGDIRALSGKTIYGKSGEVAYKSELSKNSIGLVCTGVVTTSDGNSLEAGISDFNRTPTAGESFVALYSKNMADQNPQGVGSFTVSSVSGSVVNVTLNNEYRANRFWYANSSFGSGSKQNIAASALLPNEGGQVGTPAVGDIVFWISDAVLSYVVQISLNASCLRITSLSTKKYQHNIYLERNSGDVSFIWFSFINNISTPYTSYNSLRLALRSLGFDGSTTGAVVAAHGVHYYSNETKQVYALYGATNTNYITFITASASGKTNMATIGKSYTVFDEVIAL